LRNKEQTYYIIGAVLLLALLYFGFDNKPSSQKALEKSRALNSQEYDISSFQAEAKKTLKEDEIEYLETLEAQVQHAGQDSIKIRVLKQLSGFWFQLRNPLMAGLYAKEIAKKENIGSSWAIAGTSFASGLQQEGLDEKQKVFIRNQALEAFENAISLEPDIIDHRINQALCYIEFPEEGQPMKGIQMLAGLATSYPESPIPPFHLARLAVRTGQMERAQTRIEQALKLDPGNPRIACLAIEIYTALQKPDEALKLQQICAGQQ
jgi:tetratricopeptide (TPR) repeat protein